MGPLIFGGGHRLLPGPQRTQHGRGGRQVEEPGAGNTVGNHQAGHSFAIRGDALDSWCLQLAQGVDRGGYCRNRRSHRNAKTFHLMTGGTTLHAFVCIKKQFSPACRITPECDAAGRFRNAETTRREELRIADVVERGDVGHDCHIADLQAPDPLAARQQSWDAIVKYMNFLSAWEFSRGRRTEGEELSTDAVYSVENESVVVDVLARIPRRRGLPEKIRSRECRSTLME